MDSSKFAQIEIDLMCDLTPRQKYMYNTLRTNISLSDLVQRAQNLSSDENAVKRLMNLIMQFRKVSVHLHHFLTTPHHTLINLGLQSSRII